MDRTKASYKLTLGLAETFKEGTLNHIRSHPFSLNIDESTSNNRKRVLAILVSYFPEMSGKVVVEQLASLSVTKVDAKSLFNEMSTLFEQNKIPWNNLISILMDSCSVMRGSKSGLETRLRQEKASHLLDIDGDTCHHIHNATKVMCNPFDGHLERLYMDLANDFKYSVDLSDSLACMCELLGMKFTMPERYVSHRWLSMYDVSLGNNRLYDAYVVFYYSFLSNDNKRLYKSMIMDIFHSRKVSSEAAAKCKDLQQQLAKKSFTKDGKARKERIIDKLIFHRKKTQLFMNFYIASLPTMKSYVMLFETKEPLVHKLLDKQEELFRELLGFFMKPQFFQDKSGKALQQLDLENKDTCLSKGDLFYGHTNEILIEKSHPKDIVITDFKDKVARSYQVCAKYLQGKLPLGSKLLKAFSAIDPAAHGHSATLHQLKKLPGMVVNVLTDDEKELYMKEVHTYSSGGKLPLCFKDGTKEPIRVDVWWQQVSNRYPALSKMAKAILTCFHGPQVEGSFNVMGDVLDSRSSNMNISSFSSIQTVKYTLRSKEKTAVQHFHRRDILHEPVSRQLSVSMRSARGKYKAILKQKNDEQIKRQEELKLSKEKLQAKKKQQGPQLSLQKKKAKLAHQKQRRVRLANLKKLEENVLQKDNSKNDSINLKRKTIDKGEPNLAAKIPRMN